mmetsp:Transcript_7178/g.7882  ORF Transcript_7178/g.7882 Transcript_7178/m.7882 type:complete len:226 (-) Transcript_7178:67-744(-)
MHSMHTIIVTSPVANPGAIGSNDLEAKPTKSYSNSTQTQNCSGILSERMARLEELDDLDSDWDNWCDTSSETSVVDCGEQILRDIPFWFGNEDKEHLLSITKIYTKALKINQNRVNHPCFPSKFIGRIARQVVDADLFQTLDTIDIYLSRKLAPTCLFTPTLTIHALTTWDENDGLPTTVFVFPDEKRADLLDLWSCRTFEDDPSIIYALPRTRLRFFLLEVFFS